MNIPFLDVLASYNELKNEIDASISRVLGSGTYILGPEVEIFEENYSRFCNSNHCVALGNGLDAVYLSLASIGIKAGDEVIVPANTFIATWMAVTRCGAVPVPVDPILDTYNIDSKSIEKCITKKTKAIVLVHLYGQPVDIDPILELARERNLRVIEDAAQAHGAKYKDASIGAHSDIVAWSFYPSKNLGAMGDSGAITTNDSDLASRIRSLGNYGSSGKYEHVIQGVNSRMDPVQAAILNTKLEHLEAWNNRRKALAKRYSEGLSNTDCILPVVPEWADPVWHLYVIRNKNRDKLKIYLEDAGVGCSIHYPVPPHLQKAYENLSYRQGDFPVTESISQQVLSLPIGPHLSTDDQDRVIDLLQSFVG